MKWFTLVLGIPSLFAVEGGLFQVTGWSRKQTRSASVAIKNAKLLQRQLHHRGFSHWEVRIAVHYGKDFPHHGNVHPVSEVT